jgi:hypothetical protein
MGIFWMPEVRGEGGRLAKRGNWGARRQNYCWNIQKRKKIAASKWVSDLHHSSSSNEYKLYIRIVKFLLLLLFSHPSAFESLLLLDGRLN